MGRPYHKNAKDFEEFLRAGVQSIKSTEILEHSESQLRALQSQGHSQGGKVFTDGISP